MRNRALLLTGAALAAGVVAYLFSAPSAGSPAEGAPAPDFKLTDLSGRSASLADYRGKVVLLDFWATWCPSCEQELPSLKALNAKLSASDFALLAPSVDEAGPEVVARYAAEKALPWRVLFADDAVAKAYRVFGLPTKYLIARDGRVARKYLEVPDPAALEKDIMAELSRRPS